MSVTRWLSVSALILALGWAAGCGDSGPKRYGVSGTVTYKGEPIKNGLISFIPQGSQASAGGASIINGKYEVPAKPGLPPGQYAVSINVPTGAGKAAPGAEEAPGAGGEKATRETLPAKYNSKTELKADVQPSKTMFDFELK